MSGKWISRVFPVARGISLQLSDRAFGPTIKQITQGERPAHFNSGLVGDPEVINAPGRPAFTHEATVVDPGRVMAWEDMPRSAQLLMDTAVFFDPGSSGRIAPDNARSLHLSGHPPAAVERILDQWSATRKLLRQESGLTGK